MNLGFTCAIIFLLFFLAIGIVGISCAAHELTHIVQAHLFGIDVGQVCFVGHRQIIRHNQNLVAWGWIQVSPTEGYRFGAKEEIVAYSVQAFVFIALGFVAVKTLMYVLRYCQGLRITQGGNQYVS